MIYYFLVESKQYERIDLLIIASINIYRKKRKKNIRKVMKTCFSEEKLIAPFLTESPLSAIPLFLSNFFMTPFFVQILKTRHPS